MAIGINWADIWVEAIWADPPIWSQEAAIAQAYSPLMCTWVWDKWGVR